MITREELAALEKAQAEAVERYTAAFRPLKTEKERVVEYWLAKLLYKGSDMTRFELEALYDAGALKMPGGE